jgi:hypothetical protein
MFIQTALSRGGQINRNTFKFSRNLIQENIKCKAKDKQRSALDIYHRRIDFLYGADSSEAMMFHPLVYIGIALIFALLKIVLEKRLAPLDAAGDENRLSGLAYDRGCSVFDLFKEAGAKWNFSKTKIDADFRQYVQQGFIPTYLHDYLEKNSKMDDHTYQKVLFSGGRPPYL